MTDFSEDERRQYAAHLILERGRNVHFLDIMEGAPEFFEIPDNEYLDEATAELIDRDISKAIIRVSWPNSDVVYSDNFGDEDEGGT
jgi:hypothetical protein